MTAVTLFLDYPYGHERVPFDPERPPTEGSATVVEGFWPDEGVITTYTAITSYSRQEDGSHILRLKIARETIGTVPAGLEFYWGTAVITLTPDITTGSVVWEKDTPQESAPRGKIACTVIRQAVERDILYEAVTRIRREQDRLRNALVTLDARCAITGERTTGSLQAAHIHEVRHGGIDDPSNAVLMRADIHALYDRGYFEILRSGAVDIRRMDDLSPEYLGILKEAKVASDVLNRIAENLTKREETRRACC